jgi:hypothetical protein
VNVSGKVADALIVANPLIWPVMDVQSLRVYPEAAIPPSAFAFVAVVALAASVAVVALVALVAFVAVVALVAVFAVSADCAEFANATCPAAICDAM